MNLAKNLTDRHTINGLKVEAVDFEGDTVHVQFINGGQAMFSANTWLDLTRSGKPNWDK